MNSSLILNDTAPVTLEKQSSLRTPVSKIAVSIIRDENPIGNTVVLNPHAVKALVDNEVKVFIQRGFSANSSYSDMDYANEGAEFEDEFVNLASMSKLLLKLTPFTREQMDMLHDSQIILSTQHPTLITASDIQSINDKKISALAFNLIKDSTGYSFTDKILTETLSPIATNIALSNFILPMLLDILLNPNFRFALQRTPALMQSVYCYGGYLCNREMAELLNLPCRDIVSLCWDLN